MAFITYVVATGEIVAFCSGTVSSAQAVLEVSDEEWSQVVKTPGYTVQNNALVLPAG